MQFKLWILRFHEEDLTQRRNQVNLKNILMRVARQQSFSFLQAILVYHIEFLQFKNLDIYRQL